ncbi:hypothetical protein [Plesiomonas shigelloides]|uniref:hypothetical protein n=1 Tax=Plesiomonas shigelloides TaxID=703 RepID=UPI0015B75712|nr:hypothetical protein [Plesiomonas shigelloides]
MNKPLNPSSSLKNKQHYSHKNTNDWLFAILIVALVACGVLLAWFGVEDLVKAVEQLNG